MVPVGATQDPVAEPLVPEPPLHPSSESCQHPAMAGVPSWLAPWGAVLPLLMVLGVWGLSWHSLALEGCCWCHSMPSSGRVLLWHPPHQ